MKLLHAYPALFSSALAPLLAGLLVAAPGCDKKDPEGSTPPDDTGLAGDDGAATDDGGDGGEAKPSLPPQDADPPELAVALVNYEQGKYEDVKSAMEALLPSLEGDTKVRAKVIANAYFAMAVAEEFPENAHDHVEIALAEVERLDDPEAQQIALTANGAYLLGVAEFVQAQQELAKAEGLEGGAKLVAMLLHAQSVLNQAFDDNDRITDPAKLEAAKAEYQRVIDAAEEPTLKGRAEAGLAAIAKYQGKNAEVCTHATAAAEHYEAGDASDYIKEVPSLLKKDAKCK